MAGLGMIGSAIAGGIGGLGEGFVKAGKMYGDYAERTALQEQEGEIQKARDQRLAELKEQAEIRAEQRKAAPYKEAQAATEAWGKANTTYDESSGTAIERAPSTGETRAHLIQELRSRGAHTAAHEFAKEELEKEKISVEKAGIERRSEQEKRQFDIHMAVLERQIKVQTAHVNVEAGKLKLLAESHEIDLAKAKEMNDLRKKYLAETDPEKKLALGDEVSLLTNGLTEKYKPVFKKDEFGKETDQVIGFADLTRGRYVPLNTTSGGSDPWGIRKEDDNAESRATTSKPGSRAAVSSATEAYLNETGGAGFDQPPPDGPSPLRSMQERNRRLEQTRRGIIERAYSDRYGIGL